MRSGAATQAPQGTMAEQYTQGLGANGPQNLAGVMGQSQMMGQPVPYAGGQMQATPPQEEQAPRLGFAAGGLIPGFEPFSPGGSAGGGSGMAALASMAGVTPIPDTGLQGGLGGTTMTQNGPVPNSVLAAAGQIIGQPVDFAGGAADGTAGSGQGGNAGAGTGDDGDGGTGGGTGATYADGGEISGPSAATRRFRDWANARQPMMAAPGPYMNPAGYVPEETYVPIQPDQAELTAVGNLDARREQNQRLLTTNPDGSYRYPSPPGLSVMDRWSNLGRRIESQMAVPPALENAIPPQENYSPRGLWGSDAPPGTGVNGFIPPGEQEEYGPGIELAPDGAVGARPATRDPNAAVMSQLSRGLGGGGGGGGGGGAIRTPQGLAEFIGEVRSQMGPDRYAALAKDNASAKEALKAAKETDKGLALLQAGLGILAGTSPNAGVNIGRGATLGLQAYQETTRDNNRAEQGLRTADQQIAIAQANRDERLLETALKSKMHWEEQIQRSLDRQATAGAAAGARADAQEMRKAALEDSKLNRAETRALREHDSAVKDITEAGKELRDAGTEISALSKDFAVSPAEKEARMARLNDRQEEAREAMRTARARLRAMQGEVDTKKGREIPKPTGPAGVYVPGKGIQWAN